MRTRKTGTGRRTGMGRDRDKKGTRRTRKTGTGRKTGGIKSARR